MNNYYNTILSPIITEKATKISEKNQFVFKVKIDSTNDDKFYGSIIEVFGNFDDDVGLTNYFINYFNLSTEFSEKVLKNQNVLHHLDVILLVLMLF